MLKKKHVKRLYNNKKKMFAEENLKLKSILKLNNIFNDDQIKVLIKMHTVLNGQLAQLCSAIKVFMWKQWL